MSALRASVWAPPIGIAAIILLAVAMLDIGASARGMGGGARGGGGRGVSYAVAGLWCRSAAEGPV